MMHIGNRPLGQNHPTYFIADIGANHDGSLDKALELIHLAKKSGADAAKFQHFKAETIVSKSGFEKLGGVQTHQSKWKKAVYDVYKEASINIEWTNTLYLECKKVGIDFFTSPYDLDLVDHIDSYVPAYKIGSGDIDWLEIIEKIAKKNKPTIIATGACSMQEIHDSVDLLKKHNITPAILQCNTNYTGSVANFKFVNLRVIKSLRRIFFDSIIGLSDHTPGNATALGAVALGARIIEKHFTDNKSNSGPDHGFAMDSRDWKEMVDRVRELESALGDGKKKIEENEKESFKVQRRSVRTKANLEKGMIISREDLVILRPRSQSGLSPALLKKIIGKKLISDIAAGDEISWKNIES